MWKTIADIRLRFLDAAILTIAIATTVFYVLYWPHMPEQVPVHWSGTGKIDNYAHAGSYIMLLILMYFFLAWHAVSKVCTSLIVKENLFGKELAKKAVSEDEEEGIRVILYMLWWCDLIVQATVAYIILCGVLVRNLGVWFLPAVFIGLTVVLVRYLRKMAWLKERVKGRGTL